VINNELFEFSKPGTCHDGVDKDGQYRMCVLEVLPDYKINDNTTTDSVFVFKKVYTDTHTVEVMISASDNFIVSKLDSKNGQKQVDQLKQISNK
jgi:hypothetical protein